MNENGLLFKITKIIAESDSIAEGYRYCMEFTQEDWERELNNESCGWIDVAREILNIIKEENIR
jgi:hypothetical protein